MPPKKSAPLAEGFNASKENGDDKDSTGTLHGIPAKGRRRFEVTTDSNRDLPFAPNLLAYFRSVRFEQDWLVAQAKQAHS